MITLKRLRVDSMKRLHDVDLWFPRRGSVLVEGQNESGKSTLFEAIYFALYGRALVGEDPSRPSLAALIPHERAQADVSLTLLVGEAELQISRRVTRGRSGAITSEATLIIRRSGRDDEKIHAVSAVNNRIEQELHGIDGDTLRNSCFMEQKALERIEALPRDSRDKAISRLLGLERLMVIEQELAPTSEERARVERLREQVRLAEHRERAQNAAAHADDAERLVRAAELRDRVNARDEAARLLDDIARREAALTREQEELEQRIGRIEALRDLERRLNAADETRVRALQAQTQADALADRLDELTAAERLPEAERRLAALQMLERRLTGATEKRALLAKVADIARQLATSEAELARAREASARSEQELAQARMGLGRTRVAAVLVNWARARENVDGQADSELRLRALQRDRESQSAAGSSVRAESGRWLMVTAGSGGITLVATILATATSLIAVWGIVLVALGVATFAGLQWRRAMTDMRTREWRIAQIDQQITAISTEANLTRRLGEERLGSYEAELRAAGAPIPESVAAAHSHIAATAQHIDMAQAEERVRQADSAVARAHIAEEQLEIRFTQARMALEATGMAGMARVIDSQLAANQQEIANIEQQARELGAPTNLAELTAARGAAAAAVESLAASAGTYQKVTARLVDERALVEQSREEYARILAAVASELRGMDAEPVSTGWPVMEGVALDAERDSLAAALTRAIDALDEPAARAQAGALAADRERLTSEEEAAQATYARLTETIRAALDTRGIAARGDEPQETLFTLWPELGEISAHDLEQLQAKREEAMREAYHANLSMAERARESQLDGIALDEDDAREQLASAERDVRQRALAAKLASEARSRIIRSALPETEAYMRAILPQLTDGRYRDVSLVRDETLAAQGEVDLAIRLWDEVAGRFVRKNLFSGGARDQASLALRLAFALATLPRERGVAPGFIFLDEPLSAFDAQRSRALAHVLTRGAIAEAFAQIFLISHSQVIDPRDFDYTLRMEDGRVSASTLPSQAIAESLWTAEEGVTVTTERQHARL